MRASRVFVIAGREARSIVASPSGAIIIGTFWAVAGLILMSLLFQYRDGVLRLAQTSGMQTGPRGLHINDWVIRLLVQNMGTVLVLFVPLLTMRGFAEERRTGNLELLMSQPVRGAELLLGKFLGAQLSLLACLAVLIPHAVVLAVVSTPDWVWAATAVFGLLLVGLLFGAVGTLLSVLSRSQIEAGVLSLGALLLLAMGPGSLASGRGLAAAIGRYLSILGRFEDFARGVMDLGHVAFFLGATLVILALALRSLDLVRWQG
ncbi:MAG: ABC transporter permease subunit [Candidatus Eisenbacteria bacterium]|uniref:ABC transporter permease subunit n=1 Tax=Eiseniibacteriota bacterium TaxID=2212470 RepID=A0A956RPA5_UNCEI|nr:ABC transporter permease subunit [Candidatus Eisenbacteria bacterium]